MLRLRKSTAFQGGAADSCAWTFRGGAGGQGPTDFPTLDTQ